MKLDRVDKQGIVLAILLSLAALGLPAYALYLLVTF
jgi:hypothetical protein